MHTCRGNPRGLPSHVRIFTVHFPLYGIVDDVFPYSVQFVFIADDMFVVIALPEFPTGGAACFINAFGYRGFESANYGANGLRW